MLAQKICFYKINLTKFEISLGFLYEIESRISRYVGELGSLTKPSELPC